MTSRNKKVKTKGNDKLDAFFRRGTKRRRLLEKLRLGIKRDELDENEQRMLKRLIRKVAYLNRLEKVVIEEKDGKLVVMIKV